MPRASDVNAHQRRIHRRKVARMTALIQRHLQRSIDKFVGSTLSDHIQVQLQDTIINLITVELKF